ncbi:hypothetical protein K443DRAFT_508669 [Laccaria amethystina LaAM-08-1]|uniref:Uncharacterized protein n=1 Tax=Laccaria amethystina LaAM-08-1 TaxID=1095629 RepID=A0A0C9WMG1_9AGAR|nr:hypothetical protein K443DRAFT_508669 [Laccaria amethystina LaAM-08-1]
MLHKSICETVNVSWRTFLWLVFHDPRLVWILAHSLKMLPKTVYMMVYVSWRTFLLLVFHDCRLILILTHSLKTLPKTFYKTVDVSPHSRNSNNCPQTSTGTQHNHRQTETGTHQQPMPTINEWPQGPTTRIDR